MKQKLLIFAIIALFSAPFFVNAAGLVPCGGPTESPCTVMHAFYMIARVTNWLIMAAGLFAVYNIVNHAFWFVPSMGNEEDITKHKRGITNTLIGLFVVLAAYMFMNTAVNGILRSKCKVDFSSPWTYITMTNPSNEKKCLQPTDDPATAKQSGYNPVNDDILKK